MKISKEEEIEEFLSESNAIEREYSDEALEDAKKAWNYAYLNRKNIDVPYACYVLEIHELLLQRLEPEIAGKVRDCAVAIGGEIKEQKTEQELMIEIIDWVKSCKPVGKATEKEIQKWHVEF